MRPNGTHLDRYRRRHPELGTSPAGTLYGFFVVRSLAVISSGVPDRHDPSYPWEHVSVSLRNRCPTWEEMSMVKDLFWAPDEGVVQFHPPKAAHINEHPYCLHLWARHGEQLQLPPAWTVGPLPQS